MTDIPINITTQLTKDKHYKNICGICGKPTDKCECHNFGSSYKIIVTGSSIVAHGGNVTYSGGGDAGHGYPKQDRPDPINVKKKCNQLGVHYCEGSTNVNHEPEYYAYHRTAFDKCYDIGDGRLFIDNREYSSQVNFCPYCGYEANVKTEIKHYE